MSKTFNNTKENSYWLIQKKIVACKQKGNMKIKKKKNTK